MQCWPRQGSHWSRSSVKKRVIRNFTKFTENTCIGVSFYAEACNFIKKETLAQVFSFEFCDIFKNTYFTGSPGVWATASAQLVRSRQNCKLFFCEKLFEDGGLAFHS